MVSENDATSVRDMINWSTCRAFVAGVIGGSAMARTSHDLKTHPGEVITCLPDRVQIGQLLRVVKKFLQDNPNTLHFSASSLVKRAVADVFPCRGTP